VTYHNRRFRPAKTTENGEVNADTVFHYRQEGAVLWATYEGGGVRHGHMIGTVAANGDLAFRYHHLSAADHHAADNAAGGEPVSGMCHSRLEVLPDGRYRLFEQWQWTSGDLSAGTSVLEEIDR